MPENEFEKQVQQKMEELKFSPSEEVWKNVAAAIAKRKKDRWFYAIIFLSLLLISTAIFILFNYTTGQKNNKLVSYKNNPVKTNSTTEQIIHHESGKIVRDANVEKPVGKDSIVNGVPMRIDNMVIKKINNQPKTAPVFIAGKASSSVEEDKSVNNNSVSTKDDVHSITNKQQFKTKPKLNTLVSNSDPADLANAKGASVDDGKLIADGNIIVINNLAEKGQPTDSVAKDRIDSSKHINDTLVIVLLADNKKDTAVKKTIQSKQNSEWKLGFNFSLGATTTQNGYLGIGGSGNNQSYAYASGTQTAGSYPGQVNNATYNPSTIKPGAGIVVGLFVQKNISSRTKILLGLYYRTYSSIIMTGARVDSGNLANNNIAYYGSGNYYYSSGTSVQYKNNFHFIELPVAFQFKLSKQNKLPVYLSTGVYIAQLISSNALQFDTSSGRYFTNNDLFNKTQFNLSVGLLFSLSRQAKNPFLIGPDLNFSLNKMANSGLYKNTHYSYLGILIQKTIGKK